MNALRRRRFFPCADRDGFERIRGGEHIRGFYGPAADEGGGVVLVDDTDVGSLLLLGDFVAD